MLDYKPKTNREAFTIIEVMVVSIILVIVLVGFLGVFSMGLYLNESSKNTAIALADARSVLERIRNIDPFTAANISAAFPDGATVAGVNNLVQESVQVDYIDLSADPIQINITVTWQEKTRTRTETLVTLMTQR